MKFINWFLEKLCILCVSAITLITPIHSLLITMLLFVISDTVFALYKSYKLDQPITSHKLFNIVPKMFLYLGSIILAFAINTSILNFKMFGVDLLLSKSVTVLWIYIEVKSMDETSKALGNKSLWHILYEMIDRIKEIKKKTEED